MTPINRVLVTTLLLTIGGTLPSVEAFECTELVRANKSVDVAGFDEGLLWRIESASGAVSYIFGTIHISDERVTNLPAPVREALDRSPHFGMEVILDGSALQRMSMAMFAADGSNGLGQLLDPLSFAQTTRLLLRYGVSEQAARVLKPWAAFTTLSLPPGQSGVPLDLALLGEARQSGKSTFGLETIDEQIAVFADLKNDEQVQILAQTVCHYGDFQAELEEMVQHYLARDLSAVMEMAIRYESPLKGRFLDILLRQRNHRMVARLESVLTRGGAFVAVGALHLPGPEGILRLLRSAGFKVEREY